MRSTIVIRIEFDYDENCSPEGKNIVEQLLQDLGEVDGTNNCKVTLEREEVE